jgi:hypothetical protein
MASHDAELLAAADELLSRETRRRGPLPRARVRRSISTAYYALFHFSNAAASWRATSSMRFAFCSFSKVNCDRSLSLSMALPRSLDANAISL